MSSKLSIGIVGLPNAGKSTLFNALVSQQQAQTGKHPFTTIDKNVAVVAINDSTLFKLAKMANISKITKSDINFIDIAGLVKNAHQGQGLGNQFLSHIREVNLILHIVRFFTDETVSHIDEKIDSETDVSIVETELLLADIESLNKQLTKLKKNPNDKQLEKTVLLGDKILKELNNGKMAKDIETNDEEKKLLNFFNLLTSKPVIYVGNVNENNLKTSLIKIKNKKTISVCAKFEEELAQLPKDEQNQFLKTYDLEKSAINLIIDESIKKLNLIAFYTISGGKEARAWLLKKGETAHDAAGKIHTDFAKKFIKAEIIPAELLLSIGSWGKAQEMGKIILGGKDYIVKDKDVIQFKI